MDPQRMSTASVDLHMDQNQPITPPPSPQSPAVTNWDSTHPKPPREQVQEKADPLGCLFVASLSSSRTDEQLQESVLHHFQQWGEIVDVKVMKDWANRPYAFVQFRHARDAQRALVEANSTMIHNRPIRIEQAKVNRTLFLAKFARYASRDEMMRILERFGPLEEFKLLHSVQTGQSKGCAFAKFKYREDAIRAYMNLRLNSSWVVEWASNMDKCGEGSVEVDKTSIFVGNLHGDMISEDMLQNRFEKYGEIVSLQLFHRSYFGEGLPSSFAFIQYSHEESARQAIEQENGSAWLDTTLRVQYRETSESRLQRHHSVPLSNAPRWPPIPSVRSRLPTYAGPTPMMYPVPWMPPFGPIMDYSMGVPWMPPQPMAFHPHDTSMMALPSATTSGVMTPPLSPMTPPPTMPYYFYFAPPYPAPYMESRTMQEGQDEDQVLQPGDEAVLATT